MLLCYVIDSGLSTSLLLLATLIIMFYIYITLHWDTRPWTPDINTATISPAINKIHSRVARTATYQWILFMTGDAKILKNATYFPYSRLSL